MCNLLLGLLLFAQADTTDYYYEAQVKYTSVPDLNRIIGKTGVVVWDSCRITEQVANWQVEVTNVGKGKAKLLVPLKDVFIVEKNSGLREPLLLPDKVTTYTVRRVKKK